MSFDNLLIFTGKFIQSSDNDLIGKNLYIPVTENHPAFTFKITRTTWPGTNDNRAIVISFNSVEERETVAGYDFRNEVFYIDE